MQLPIKKPKKLIFWTQHSDPKLIFKYAEPATSYVAHGGGTREALPLIFSNGWNDILKILKENKGRINSNSKNCLARENPRKKFSGYLYTPIPNS